MGDKTSKSSGRNLQKVAQFLSEPLISMMQLMELMQAAVKIIKSSPIGRLNRGFGNTDCWFYPSLLPLVM